MPRLKNTRHEKFCQEYSQSFNTLQSYKKAFKTNNDKTASVNGTRLLENTSVKQRIEELKQKLDSKMELKGEEVIEKWQAIANFNISDIMEFNGVEAYVKDFSQIPKEVLYNIKSIETQKLGKGDDQTLVTKITFYSKEKALDALSRIKGLYNDKVTVQNKTIEDLLREVN